MIGGQNKKCGMVRVMELPDGAFRVNRRKMQKSVVYRARVLCCENLLVVRVYQWRNFVPQSGKQ